MPHLVILYTPNLDAWADLGALCRQLADAMLIVRDEAGAPVFPVGGTRVMAFAAQHYAVADGSGDHAFCWLNLRMGGGRSNATKHIAGEAIKQAATAFFAPVLLRYRVGITCQVDESTAQVFDARIGNLHALFAPPAQP
jgi:5-carboxymethyl-2-hydroxymuconate isomerase